MQSRQPDRCVWSALFICCGFILLLAGGCSNDPEPGDQSRRPTSPVPTPPEPAPPPAPEAPSTPSHCPVQPTTEGRLVVDISGSMVGFTGVRKAAVANVHQVLQDTFAEAHLPGVRRCLLGVNLDCERAPEKATKYARAGLYRARVSRLDLALRPTDCPEQPDPDHPVIDLLDEARLTVVVTDGMQAASGAAATESGTGCEAGADPSCIASLLAKRASTEYGVWLVQVALPFKGRHYAERALDEAFYKRVATHLEEANRNTRWNGIEFGMRASRRGNNSYDYEGFKPLLLIVLTRDEDLGRRFVDIVVRRLRADPIRPGEMSDEDAVQSVELAPLRPASFRPIAIEALPTEQQEGISAEELAEFRFGESTQVTDGAEARIWCGARGKGLLAVRYERDATKAVLPEFIREEVELVGPRRDVPLPDRAVAPLRPLPSQAFRAGVNCTVLPAAHVTVVEYELRSRLQLDEESTNGEWWSELSSDNTYEMPERIYGLRNLALAVLRSRVQGVQRWGRVRLRVERE